MGDIPIYVSPDSSDLWTCLLYTSSQMESAIKIDASAFQKAIQLNMTASELTELMRSTLRSSSATYEACLLYTSICAMWASYSA